MSIDYALAVSYRRNMYDNKSAYVAHITLVKGIPFYGYHVGYKFFLKIYMLNPSHTNRLADLLRQGAILRKEIQPFESHMQYLAQWMCDYNLYGCAYINCKEVKFRRPIPEFLDLSSNRHEWHDRSIDDSLISDENKLPRQSNSSLEVDICVQDILNRLEIKARHLHHDFIERNHPPNSSEKFVHSMAELWRDESRRRRMKTGETSSSPFQAEELISLSADPRESQRGGWIHEEEYMAKVRTIIEDERQISHGKEPTFDTFVAKNSFETQVKTSLESVEDLFPENLEVPKASREAFQIARQAASKNILEEVEVDENRVLSFMEADYPFDSDEEPTREPDLLPNEKGKPIDKPKISSSSNHTNEATAEDAGALEQFRGLYDPSPSQDSQDPTSSTELEALGIRRAGDYSHVDEDAFKIPLEFTSNRNLKVKHSELDYGDLLPFEPPAKRLKHTATSVATSFFASKFDHASREEIQDLPISDDQPSVTFPDNSTKLQLPPKKNISFHPKSSSQEVLTPNGSNGNMTLSFPVVKDPNDSTTILRLSQRSKSPEKGLAKNKMKFVTFDPSLSGISSFSGVPEASSPEQSRLASTPSSQILQFSSKLYEAFDITSTKRLLCFAQDPPDASDTFSMMARCGNPHIIYRDAYYSDEKDVPERAREYAGKEFKIESDTISYLPDFDPTGTSLASKGEKYGIVVDRVGEEKLYRNQRRACNHRVWEIDEPSPTSAEVQGWLDKVRDHGGDPSRTYDRAGLPQPEIPSQINGATQKNRYGFKYSQKQTSENVQQETQYMSLMSLEIHTNTRGSLMPNPEQDEIKCIFWCIQSDGEDFHSNGTHIGIVVLSEGDISSHTISRQTSVEVDEESNELDLINRLVELVRNYDPDILTGYEVHGGSWGYIIERAKTKYDYNVCEEISRTKSHWGYSHASTIKITGRHLINISRAMRGELNLLQYTMENVVFHVLHRRVPHYSYQDLTSWYKSRKSKDLAKVIDYYICRVQLDLEILEQNESVTRTSEQARLLGVDFFSVFSRGSQFKVESLMFRIAKPENFLLPSPSRKQVGHQNALECLPLIMEPQSAFYTSPVLVLDFQSLYPSVMIAYNYCYSTCLGRVASWRGQNKMGFSDYSREHGILELLKDQINIAPNGIIYVKPGIRKSLLAKMLGEILETRVMVKGGMKAEKDDKTLQRLLNNRQLALKLIANVTYGYTSASFSGRMPCSEIADSIVQTSRETLERSIAFIHSVERWGAEVVYGDTDSLFIHLKGRTKDEAFEIGSEITAAITNMNPRPMKLKFEKVYLPCVLLAKKRYVGFKYESKLQKEPEFEAKGIETVRRDGTPAEQKIEEKALKILFRTKDLSQVKSYFQSQCTKIMQGRVSIQDFCFAKEVRLGTYSTKGVPPPGALISTRRMLEDPRAEPQNGERVPYVVITGAPGARLIDRCVAPDVLLHNDQNELDSEYYITKNLIPPLERIFNLVGANVRQWYDEMPKVQRIRRIEAPQILGGTNLVATSKKTLESYLKSSSCLACREKTEEEMPICSSCMKNAPISLLTLRSRLGKAEKKAANMEIVCRSCAGLAWGEEVKCDSKDCPVFYTRVRHMASLRNTRVGTEPVVKVLEDLDSTALEW